MVRSVTSCVRLRVIVALALSLAPASANAQYSSRPPESQTPAVLATRPAELNDVTVTENLMGQVPLDTEFRDHRGNTVRLSQFFDGRRPVLLNLAYNRCPQLCNMVQNAMVQGIRQTEWNVGEQFDIVTISIDPREGPREAAEKRVHLLDLYHRPSGERGWHSLTGSEASIRRVAEAVGFGYRYDARQGQYAHPAAIFLLTPDGRIARYLYGLEFRPSDLRLGLLEASQGRSITTVERMILFCYHYDPQGGRYVLVAQKVMRLGGAVTIVLLGGLLAVLWARERGKRRDDPPSSEQSVSVAKPTTPLAPPHDVRG